MTVIADSYNRIKDYLYKTPILYSEYLNQIIGHNIYFKAESLQKTGAFKIRGVLNHLLALREQYLLPTKISAYTTGNHGIALAWASKLLNIKLVRLYLTEDSSAIKQHIAKCYNAEIIITKTRSEAEKRAQDDVNVGFYYFPPSHDDNVTAGASTIHYEALQQLEFIPDAIFAACGGGGLLSGLYLSNSVISPSTKLIGAEPLQAGDAFFSLYKKKKCAFTHQPETIADGLRALRISDKAFDYIRRLDDMVLVPEVSIAYWTKWLMSLLNITCEPSGAINMGACCNWLVRQNTSKNILIIISGGNVDSSVYKLLYENDFLQITPNIDYCHQSTISLYNSNNKIIDNIYNKYHKNLYCS